VGLFQTHRHDRWSGFELEHDFFFHFLKGPGHSWDNFFYLLSSFRHKKKNLERAKGGMAVSLPGSATVTTLLFGELLHAGVNIPRARFLHG